MIYLSASGSGFNGTGVVEEENRVHLGRALLMAGVSRGWSEYDLTRCSGEPPLMESGQSKPLELSSLVMKAAPKWKRVGAECLVECSLL